jgi:hypothetical protein
MNHTRRIYLAIALLALVVIVDVACAPITITTNAPNAPPAPTAALALNVITVPNSVPVIEAAAIDAEMPFKFFLIHSVFSPDQ